MVLWTVNAVNVGDFSQKLGRFESVWLYCNLLIQKCRNDYVNFP